jgi:hypothetical protein
MKALTKELETSTSLADKTHKGHTFIHKLKLSINNILNADAREKQRVSTPSMAAPPAMTSIEIPIQQLRIRKSYKEHIPNYAHFESPMVRPIIGKTITSYKQLMHDPKTV